MKPVYSVSALPFLLSLRVLAGGVHGHVFIANLTSHKAPDPIVYRLRGPAEQRTPRPENQLDDIAVVLEPESASDFETAKTPPRPITATIKQEDGRLRPELLVASVGSTVEFLNFSPIFRDATTQWSNASSSSGQGYAMRLDSPGVVRVRCHGSGSNDAVIVVTASPWHQKPLADGSFSFSDVPAGRYKLTVWRKSAGPYRTNVVVPENGNVDATISVPTDSDR